MTSLADSLWQTAFLGRNTYRDRAQWAHRWARHLVRWLHVETTYLGANPSNGILTANHLSYLDIVVLCAAQPLVFVAKSEVRSWPLIGWMTRCAGTLFVNRQRKADVASLAPSFAPVVAEGVVLVLFPEGTSTGGDRVLPFMSSLLEPAAENDWPVSSAWIGYRLNEGSAAEEVCYWGEMTFLPHFLNLLSKPSIQAKVVYAPAIPRGLNRKQMAKLLHDQVQYLAHHHSSTCLAVEREPKIAPFRPYRIPAPCPLGFQYWR